MKHITEGYTANIIKKFKNGDAVMNIPNTKNNRLVFGDTGRHLPFEIKAKNINKYFA